MTRIPLVHLLVATAVVLAAGVVSAQPEPRAPLGLNTPANGATVTDTVVIFSWDYPAGATLFKLALTRPGSSQSITLTATDADCFMLGCSTTLDAAAEGWLWKEGATYNWKVKAKDSAGDLVAKSNARSFTVDMLENIEIIEPDEGDVAEVVQVLPSLTGFQVEWSGISANAYYVLTLYKKDGSVKSTLSVPDVQCDVSCAYILPVDGMPVGKLKTFYLRITGTRPYVSGKMKSPKIRIRLLKL